MILPANPRQRSSGNNAFNLQVPFQWDLRVFCFTGYERGKRALDPEQVEAAVEADKQLEHAEKGLKRPGHIFGGGER